MVKISLKETNQQGRTMLELMSVMFIVSIMTMMAVQAFPTLLNKYERQKIFEEVILLANDIRSFYAYRGHYEGLNNSLAIEYGLVPVAMQNDDKVTIEHAKKGELILSVPNDLPANIIKNTIFEVKITKLSQENCQFLVRHNFSTTLSDVYRVGIGAGSAALSYHTGTNLNETLTMETIFNECACDPADASKANTCAVSLAFY